MLIVIHQQKGNRYKYGLSAFPPGTKVEAVAVENPDYFVILGV